MSQILVYTYDAPDTVLVGTLNQANAKRRTHFQLHDFGQIFKLSASVSSSAKWVYLKGLLWG